MHRQFSFSMISPKTHLWPRMVCSSRRNRNQNGSGTLENLPMPVTLVQEPQKLRNNPHKSKKHVFKMVFQFYKVYTDNLCHQPSFKITTNRLGTWENLFRRFVRHHYVIWHRKLSKIHWFLCYSLTILFVERIARSVRWEINGTMGNQWEINRKSIGNQ